MAWLSSTEFMGRSFLVRGVCRSHHCTGLGRPAFFGLCQFPRPTGRARLSSAGGLLARVCLSQQYLRNAAHVGGISGRGLRGFFGGRSV